MAKTDWKPSNMVYPLPAVDPPMCYISVRKGRHSYEFTPGKATVVNAPTIEEAPINIECEVTEVLPLGSHDMFMAKIVNVRAEEVLIDPETGAFSMKKAGLIAYAHGQYYELGKALGKFGFSVEKKKTRRKRQQRKSD